MIVCSCNVFTDHDVRNAVSAARMPPRTPGQVYGCLGCSAQCGRCALTIRKIMDEALGSCARSCCSGCQHSEAHGHSAAPIVPAVAAAPVDQVVALSVSPAMANLQERPVRRARPPVVSSRKPVRRDGAISQREHAPG